MNNAGIVELKDWLDRAQVARIDESVCIGCTLCIQACPFDAIVGSTQVMHTVIAQECTGCTLCLPPCPVDCIVMTNTNEQLNEEEQRAAALHARKRYEQRIDRLAQEAEAKQDRKQMPALQVDNAAVTRAIAKARARLNKN